jgi:acyl-CoA synthetase (AMP-forming)/AMP-acid ligase II
MKRKLESNTPQNEQLHKLINYSLAEQAIHFYNEKEGMITVEKLSYSELGLLVKKVTNLLIKQLGSINLLESCAIGIFALNCLDYVYCFLGNEFETY